MPPFFFFGSRRDPFRIRPAAERSISAIHTD
jgi:hypothetical protein